jgi:hypothetical protein
LKNSFRSRLEKLEEKRSCGANRRKKIALVLCDTELSQDFRDFKIDADVALILPDNGHRGLGKTAPKGAYSVYYH